MNPAHVVLIGAACAAVSVVVAHAAGGGARGAWAWGVFGPVGWIVAGLVGVQRRVESLEDAVREAAARPAPAAAAPAPSSAAEPLVPLRTEPAPAVDLTPRCPRCRGTVTVEMREGVVCAACMSPMSVPPAA